MNTKRVVLGSGYASEAWGVVSRLLLPPRPTGAGATAIAFCLFALGVGLGFTIFPVPPLVIACGLLGGSAWLRASPVSDADAARRTGIFWRATLVALAFALAVVAYLALRIFGWALPFWGKTAYACGFVAALVTALPRVARFRVPLVLPLGAAALAPPAAARADMSIACDDYLAFTRQPGVRVLFATTGAEASCAAGEDLGVARYPRRVWEAREPARYVVTSQADSQLGDDVGRGRPVASRFTGSFCEVTPDSGAEPRCFGSGKADGIIEAAPLDRLIIGQWDNANPAARGMIYETTRSAPLEVVLRREFKLASGGGYYVPQEDLLAVGFDEGIGLDFLRGRDLSPVGEPYRGNVHGGQIVYDEARREGVLCGGITTTGPVNGQAFLSIAFRGYPYEPRAIGPASRYPWVLAAAVFACDWDPEARTVWIGIANLPLVVPFDVDTGRMKDLPTLVTPVGVRVLTYDRPRNRVYTATWASGEMRAFDAASGRVLRDWKVGRWVRDLRISRDGTHALVTSNLGLLRVDLDF